MEDQLDQVIANQNQIASLREEAAWLQAQIDKLNILIACLGKE